MYSHESLEKLQAQYSRAGSKVSRDWPYKFAPREVRSRMAEVRAMRTVFSRMTFVDLLTQKHEEKVVGNQPLH